MNKLKAKIVDRLKEKMGDNFGSNILLALEDKGIDQ
jgi:hypothetical protein